MNVSSGRKAEQPAETEERRAAIRNVRPRRQFAECDMLMESTGVSIVKVKMKDGFPVEWCSEAACRAIGYTKEEYRAQFGCDLLSYFRGREGPLSALKEKAESAIRNGEPQFQVLLRLPSREGSFLTQCTGTFADADPASGTPASIYCVFTDVSPAAEAKEKLTKADSENVRLLEILDSIPVGVSVCTIENSQPTSITVNRHLAQQLGISGGKTAISDPEQILSYVHAADRGECRKMLSQFILGEAGLDISCRLRRSGTKSFSWVHAEGRITEQPDGGKTAFLTFTDISALKEKEKTLREAVVSAQLIVWEYDIPSHTIRMADNETTDEECRRVGFGRVIPNVPESLAAAVDERSMPALLEMYRKVEAGESASCELWYKRKPGQEPRCERVYYTPELDEEGRAVHAYAVGVNITAEKNVEEQYIRERSYLQENRDFNLISKGRYNLTQNKVLEYTMQADKTPGGNYFETIPNITYDEAAAALFRMPCAEEDLPALIDAADRQRLLERYREGHLVSRVRYRRLRRGDMPLWMSLEMRTFASPLNGDVECFSYTYDITDKVRSEEIMARIGATKFDYVGLILQKDEMFEFLQKSDAILFPEVGVRTPYSDCCSYVRKNFVADDELQQYDSAASLSNITAGLRNSDRWSSTYRRTENGKIFCKQIDYSWLDREEGIILAVRTDITASYERDQRQLLQMREAKLEADRANEAKSAFLSSMSHDMRTPLNAVLGFTDLALREENAAKKQDYLTKVKSSGGLLLDLVNDTLELSRIESGKFVLEPEAIPGREIWESVINSLRPAAELKKVALTMERPDDLNETLWVDRLKLQKILLNLISNAIKYTPAGGTVRVSVKRLDPPRNGCTRRIVVEDSGIGISPEFLPRVFEPFAQEHRAETGKVTGTGLGLAIVKRIVDLMGGAIRVQSKLSRGTRFTVELPVTTVENEIARVRREPQPLASLSGKKVLLCEDNDLNAEIAAILLKEKDAEVDRAENGSEGVRKFADSMTGYYAAVLMDIRMPVLDGCGAAKKLRALPRGDAGTVPIIAMTADAFEEDIRRAYEAGMDGYLTKPIDSEKLFRTLASALENGRGTDRGEHR